MITIKEIAKLAQVSSSTVSRYLNSSGYVGEEARERIEKVIRSTGYVPSEHAKSLRTKKTNVIGVIVPRLSTDTTSRMVNTLNDELAVHGYQIILANTNMDPVKEVENLRLLRSRQVDGIILLGTNTNQSLIDEINELSIPLVVLGQEIPGVSVIVNDDYYAAKEMTELLIEHGHQRIAFIGVAERDRSVGYLRKQGFLQAMKEHGLPVTDKWLMEANFDLHSGYLAMKKIIEAEQQQQPTAIFAVTDTMAIGAMHYLIEHGYSIPDDIAVAGTGNSEVSQYIKPTLTTIDFANEQAGKQAATLIRYHIEQKQSELKKITMTYSIIKRDSV